MGSRASHLHWLYQRLEWLCIGGIAVSLSIAYGKTLAPGLSWANGGSDGGDLISATALSGIAHPSGYPTYLLLAWVFQQIPVGDLAFRSNVFSAWCAVIASCCVFGYTRSMMRSEWSQPDIHTTGMQRVAIEGSATIAALTFGISPMLWSQAVITEVYSLNALFVVLLLLGMQWSIQRSRAQWGWGERGQSLLIGIALGNHLTILLAGIASLFSRAIIATRPADREYDPLLHIWRIMRHMSLSALWMGVGLLIYLILPLRAIRQPVITWGDPVSWSGFWWVVSGQPYRHYLFSTNPSLFFERVLAWGKLLLEQFGSIGVAMGIIGLIYGERTPIRTILVALMIGYSIFAIGYRSADSYAYLLPVYLIGACWIGLGTHRLFMMASARKRLWGIAVGIVMMGWVIWHMIATIPEVDASTDNQARVFATSVLAAAPPNAIILTSEDRDTFALWYYHLVLHHREDVVIIAEPLLLYTWYRHHIQVVYPDLRVPVVWNQEQANTPEITTVFVPSGLWERESGFVPVCSTSVDQQPFLVCKTR